MKLKTLLVNILGIVTTVLAVIVIYIVLWLESVVGAPDASTYTEFGIITFLAIYTKIFWYKSVENKVRTTDEYIADKKAFSDEIDRVVKNINTFDDFIANENIANYNRYMNSKCKLLSVENYKITLIDRLWCLFHFKKVKAVPKEFFVRRFILKHERHGLKLNQLSAARITSSTTCEFVDDRNFAKRDKTRHIVFGTVVSTFFFALFASLAFKSKENVDVAETVSKMILYITSILMNLSTTILTARIITRKDDYDYFRRIYNILDRYEVYLQNPSVIDRVKYIELLNLEGFEKPEYRSNYKIQLPDLKIETEESNDTTIESINDKTSEEQL